MVVSHPISKFRDGVTTGITFDSGIGSKWSSLFISLQNRAKSYHDSASNLTLWQTRLIKVRWNSPRVANTMSRLVGVKVLASNSGQLGLPISCASNWSQCSDIVFLPQSERCRNISDDLNLTVSTSAIKIKQSYYISGYKIQYVSVKLEKTKSGTPINGYLFLELCASCCLGPPATKQK